MVSGRTQRQVFFPKADAAILSLSAPPDYPTAVGPIYDRKNINVPLVSWSDDADAIHYPPAKESHAPSTPPENKAHLPERYLRASLTKDESFRLSMVWYYTRDIFKYPEFLSGLQEKVRIAQESTGWQNAIIGIMDISFYTRLATVGVDLGILPRGECLCSHTVARPPGSVFLLPNMLEDWRFAQSPYVESGGLRAYAGAPLRLQNESGQTACLGTICVASPEPEAPLSRAHQTALVRLADWVVSDIVQLTRARRQKARRQMVDLLAAAQTGSEDAVPEESILTILRATYPAAVISLQFPQASHVEAEGRDPVPLADLSNGLWEDVDYIDQFIAESNHLEPPTDRVVRIIAAPCESISGQSFITVGTKDFRQIFDDIDGWFVQTCAGIISETWHKRLFAEALRAKEAFLRGFSHQLRTPVHGILGSVELLTEELKLKNIEEPMSRAIAMIEASSSGKSGEIPGIYLDTIKRSGRDLISIINSMITLNRWADIAKTERQYARYPINNLEAELVNETYKAISGDSRYNTYIFFDHDSSVDGCSIWSDVGVLRDCLLPLIINAIQNTSGGNVEVSISGCREKDELIVDVKDNGCGIAPENQQRIFELYEQVDEYSTGAGIGLTLASKFAALLQGCIDLVSSEIGQGSHFRAKFRSVGTKLDSPPLEAPSIPKFDNLPKRYHAIFSGPNAPSLFSHLSKFLNGFGMTASDEVEGSVIFLNVAIVAEKRRAALSRIPSRQVIICLDPYPDGGVHSDEAFKNVIYVHGPFSISTMNHALEQADALVAQLKAEPTDSSQCMERLAIRQKPDEIARITDVSGELHDDNNVATEHVAKTVETDSARQPKLLPSYSAQVTAQPSIDTPTYTSSIAKTPLPIPITLPTSFEDFARTSHSAFPTTNSRPFVLLVDDNAINLRIVQMYCDKRSLPYLSARDGLEAVTLFKQHQSAFFSATGRTTSPIQLILMDLQMPHCDGIDATRQIRAFEKENNLAQSVVFAVTGQDSVGDRKAVTAAGGQEYLVKPVSMKSLDNEVKKYFPLFQASVK